MEIENYATTRVIRDLTIAKDLLRFVDSNKSHDRLLKQDV